MKDKQKPALSLSREEVAAIIPVVDAGIRATGIQIFRSGNGATLQSALNTMQKMVDGDGRSPLIG